MANEGYRSVTAPSTETAAIVRATTVIMGTVVGLTFLFGFGNVLNLALRLEVPVWVAPLVAPAVDLSILGLLVGTRHLALAGVSVDVLRPARRLLISASMVTLALNVAEPLVAGEYGKAAFDAVGPLLLIGWAEVGPGFLQAIPATTPPKSVEACEGVEQTGALAGGDPVRSEADNEHPRLQERGLRISPARSPKLLLDQARQQDAAHRAIHQRPISADTLRVRLRIGAAPARQLVRIVRAEFLANDAPDPANDDATGEIQNAAAGLAA